MGHYEVVVRNNEDDRRWSLSFSANSFAHAEEQAANILESDHDEIISIVKDYENV